MKNYISVNNQKIELTEDQVKQIAEAYGKSRVQLSEIPVGGTFKIGDHEFVILEHCDGNTAVIRKNLLKDAMEFGENNNYNGSRVDNVCNEFAKEIAAIIGEENMVTYTVDLTSDDGLKDYGVIHRSASLITAELYRKFVEVLDKFKPERWWWLATAHSTEKHDNDYWVKCVSPSGYFYYFHFINDGIGVRPFCILKSTIFVSK